MSLYIDFAWRMTKPFLKELGKGNFRLDDRNFLRKIKKYLPNFLKVHYVILSIFQQELFGDLIGKFALGRFAWDLFGDVQRVDITWGLG